MKRKFIIALVLCLQVYAAVAVCAPKEGQDGRHDVADSLILSEVVVKGVRTTASTNSVSSKLNHTDISKSLGKSLAAMLEDVSGLSSIRTGTIVAKPVIQGMYGNRILIVNNGARLTGQQWGEDHAPEIDKNGFSSIEVVKGAESVRYGSEALGGIIIMNPAPLPYGVHQPKGSLTTLYGSNGRRYSASGQLEGSLPGNDNLAWRLQGTYVNGGDRSTANYLLNNTGMRETGVSCALGYRSGRLKVEGSYSFFRQKMGVMLSAQMGSIEVLKRRIAIGRPLDIEPFSRRIEYPSQQITHHTGIVKAGYDLGQFGRAEYQLSLQKDVRTENRIRRMNHSDIPAVSLHLTSVQNRLHWKKYYGDWITEAGVDMLHIRNRNQAGTGIVPIIPNYTENSIGAYALQRYHHGKWGVEGGARFDHQQTNAAGYDWTGSYYGGSRQFGCFTYNIGGKYEASRKLTLVPNFGLAWRAPHVYELYSNGNELGSGMFVCGDSTLRSEQSYKWVTSMKYKTTWADVSVDAFVQWIHNYIYDQPTHEETVVISGAYPVFRYRQTSAFFRGIDADVALRPLHGLEYRMVASLIWANERSTGNYLPYIPSAHLHNQLTWTPPAHLRWLPYVSVSHRFVGKQTRFDPATDLIDTTPAAYNLFGLELGMTIPVGRQQKLTVTLLGDNLFNKEYKEYTNRARYYAHDMGRDLQCNISWIF